MSAYVGSGGGAGSASFGPGSAGSPSTPDPTLGAWASARLQASWRGIAFRVRESEIKRGRRQAVHEYPFRDDIWVEDLGRASRVTAFRGFLVGDDVDAQLKAMIAATEKAGPGTLVHPALGSMQASLIEFAARDVAEQGRVWSLEFVFLSGAQRGQTTRATDGQATTAAAAANVTTAAQGSYANTASVITSGATGAPTSAIPSIGGVLAQGQSYIVDAQQAVRGVQRTVNGFVGTVNGVMRDVSAINRAVTGISGNFGRFSLGARLSAIPGLTSATQALANANAAASSVGRLGTTLSNLVPTL